MKNDITENANKGLFSKARVAIIFLLVFILAITFVKPEKIKIESKVATFTQIDRALGETATDYPSRACGAEKAKVLFNNGEINQESYNVLIKQLADAAGYQYSFLDFRTLTRGTIPFTLLDQCRRDLMSTATAVGVVDGSMLPSVFYYKGDCSLYYYRNIGGGRFVSKVLTNMPRPTKDCPFQGATLLDVNQDGHLDLVSPQLTEYRVVTLLNDGKGNFDGEAIISTEIEKLNGQLFSISLGDLSNAGRDDIVIANRWQSPGMSEQNISSPVRILRNTGVAPYFREDTTTSIPQLQNNWTGRSYLAKTEVPNGIWYASYAVMVMDLNHDGWNDILEIGDGQANHMLWSTKGGKVFEDKSYESNIMLSTAGMGVTPVNLEGEENEQFFVSDAASTFTQQCEVGRKCFAWHGNRFYTSNNTKKFGEEAVKYNLSNTGWAFGAIFADISNNGYPQLIVGTGDLASGRADETFQSNFDKPYLMTLDESNKFTDTSYSLLRALKSPVYLNKVYVADFDGDKRNDLMLWGYESHAPILLLNRGGGSSSTLTLKGKGGEGNSTPLCTGCRVQIKIKNHKPYTLWNVFSQQNFGVTSSGVPIVIGFGDAKEGKIIVTFKDKSQKTFTIKPDKNYIISQ